MPLVPTFPSLKVFGDTVAAYGYFIFADGTASQMFHTKEGGETELREALRTGRTTLRQAEHLLERVRESKLPNIQERTQKILTVLEDQSILDAMCAEEKKDVLH